MKKVLFLLFISLFFTSCSTKNNAFKYFQKDSIEAKGIHYTKKIDILKDDEIDIILWATYLNKIDESISKTEEEKFLVSIYFANSDSQDLKENSYKIFLNQKESISIEKIEKDNQEYKELMLKNYWGNYYLISFASNEDISNLKLELTNEKSSKAILDFEK